MGTVVAAVSVIAGLSLSALLLCWFLWVYHLLSEKRESAMAARQQLQLHRDGLDQVRGSEREAAARRCWNPAETSARASARAITTPCGGRFAGFLVISWASGRCPERTAARNKAKQQSNHL